ncbi:MAG: MoaD/ThiS family protein [Candidatus Hydrogenedentes bacterium]|nr:MoaD/ThiS family protein [Candidatus Hydrogenedentota bacterium]
MQITVELFGTLREFRAADANGDAFPQDIIANTTVGDILGRLEIPTEKTLIILVNSVHAEKDQTLREGDLLAIAPLLVGG